MRRTLVVTMVTAVLLSGCSATAQDPTLSRSMPQFHDEDNALYTGSADLTVRVEGRSLAFDRTGAVVETLAIRTNDGAVEHAEHIHPTTGRVDVIERFCTVRTGGSCEPFTDLDWTSAGSGAVFGASLIAGKKVDIGSHFVFPSMCGSCYGEFEVAIAPPTAQSPMGTDFRALIPEVAAVPPRVLHMTFEHPFPLRVEGWGANLTLVSVTRGAPQPVPLTPPREISSMLQAVPFVDGFPSEGAGGAGALTWRETRDRYPGETQADGALNVRAWTYSVSPGSTFLPSVRPTTVTRSQTWSFSETDVDGAGTERMFERQEVNLGLRELGLMWSSNARPVTDQPVDRPMCDTAIPFWDAVELGRAQPWLSEFTRARFRAGSCDGQTYTVDGKLYGFPLFEMVTLDASTGLLLRGFGPEGQMRPAAAE